MSSDSSRSHALHALYSEHHGWLQRWLRSKTGCNEQAADLAQDTFVRVMSKDDSGRLREPRAFLTTVARGLLIDFFRRSELERAYLAELAALPEAAQPSAEERVLMLEALSEIERMLAGLSPRARQAFLPSRVDGLGHAEIAERIGVSTVRVRQYLAEALKRCYVVLHGEAP